MRSFATTSLIAVLCAATVPVMASEDQAVLVHGNTRFALDLYHRLRGGEGNLFISPLSLSAALGMTYGGARSRTADEMAAVLHFELGRDELHAEMAELLGGLEVSEAGHRLQLANAVWPQLGDPLLPEFVELCARAYDAAAEPLDFARATEEARKTINRWVAGRTEDRIPELLEPGQLSPMTAIVLTNAIYFRGQWLTRFDERFTEATFFTLTDGRRVEVPLMHGTGSFGYAEDADLQVLELPYSGEELSMVVLLPRRHDGLRRLEEELTLDTLSRWLAGLERTRLRVGLPRFSARSRLELSGVLRAMGMRSAFGPYADFSGMSGGRQLSLDLVVHEAFVEVNEEGTEAAAATAVTLKRGPVPPAFRADHPFLFLIRDRRTGSILFVGRLEDPTA